MAILFNNGLVTATSSTNSYWQNVKNSTPGGGGVVDRGYGASAGMIDQHMVKQYEQKIASQDQALMDANLFIQGLQAQAQINLPAPPPSSIDWLSVEVNAVVNRAFA